MTTIIKNIHIGPDVTLEINRVCIWKKVIETEHTMDLKSEMDYGHRPPYYKDNIARLYLGNRESKHQTIKF